MKKLYEIPGTETAYTVEELIGMVMAGAVENKRLQDAIVKLTRPPSAVEQVETTEQQLDLLGGEG